MTTETLSDFPQYSIPEHLKSREIDVLPIGNAMMEMIVKVSSKLDLWGQNDASISLPVYSAGGCATNVACVAARLGSNVSIVSRLGDGRYSQPILDEYHISGVDVDFVHGVISHEGNLLIIATSPDGDWTALSYMDPDLELRDTDIPPASVFIKAKFVHIDGFGFVSDRQKRAVEIAIERAKSAGCLISIDAAVPVVRSQSDYVAALFSKCDLVFANKFEAETITKTITLEDTIKALRSLGPRVSFIKMGREGSTVSTPENTGRVDAYTVEQIEDTLAAGDSYIAAVLTGLSKGKSLKSSVQWGSAAGALACLGVGSLSHRFNMEDVEKLINKN